MYVKELGMMFMSMKSGRIAIQVEVCCCRASVGVFLQVGEIECSIISQIFILEVTRLNPDS